MATTIFDATGSLNSKITNVITKITGNLSGTVNTAVKFNYPTGFDFDNTIVLSVVVTNGNQKYMRNGKDISAYIMSDGIYVYNEASAWVNSAITVAITKTN